MWANYMEAFRLVFAPDVVIAIILSSIYGLVVGSLPGLSATMATALLVPVTFYLSPIAANATIIAASAMAIFSGDIPGALLRIPGTPASAAYTDEAYAMTRKGQAEMALGAGVWFSALGGIAGTISLMALAPPLAEIALSFSTFEYFWLAFLGLMCATLVARSSPVKAIAAMLLGLLVSCVGMENPGGVPRFTFGIADLLGGIEPIPALVGVFAVSEVMRAMLTPDPPPMPKRKFGSIMAGQLHLTKKYWWPMTRGNIVGIIIGVLPGAGADMAAWVSYAMSKKFSKEPEKFGTGHVEGLVEAGASNNASLASGWVPALLFGVPGDTITAIAIGVLYMKGLNPGPTLFTEKASSMYALYIIFIIANIIMIPLGIIMIRLASRILRAPRSGIMPIIVLCCAVGSFATGNSLFAVLTVAAFGVIGYVMEANGYPVAAMVLGIVMGTMVEQSFVTSLIKSDGSIVPFFERPVSAVLAALTIGALAWPVLYWIWRKFLLRPAHA
ncbi:MAG: tripartite tricarboxylate transporter permease [Pseudolabrys sp.]|nr:tripartite tricarboxylate transporter permease [Pseudolabrys sp.]